MAVIVAPRPKLRLWDRVYLPAVIRGLWITLKHIFRRKVTLHFPEQKWPFPFGYRGYPKLVMGDNGIEKCVACKLCEVVCPPAAITIQMGEYPDQDRRERIPAEFVIDMGRCIVCGLCEEACPVDAIVATPIHHFSVMERGENILTKEKLLAIGDLYEERLAADRAADEKYR